MNEHAQALGRLAKGHPKQITPAESERRRQSLSIARAFRRAKPEQIDRLLAEVQGPPLTEEIRAQLQAKVAEVFGKPEDKP